MLIDGIGISAYRSFGAEVQRIGPFGRVNLFIGQNNTGKSNILRFLDQHYVQALESVQGIANALKLYDVDRPLGERSGMIRLEFALTLDGPNHKALLDEYHDKLAPHKFAWLDRVLKSDALTGGSACCWFCYESPVGRALGPAVSESLVSDMITEQVLREAEWRQLYASLTSKGQGNLKAHWIPGVMSALSPVRRERPEIDLIPAFRRVGGTDATETDDYGGTGIIDRLVKLQNPGHDKQELKNRFEEINRFLRTVTDHGEAELEIPYERDTILVHMGGKTLPLPSLGTGIHEVIILAAAATVLTEQVVCIEEPEIHLHPILQKKLVRYLHEKTSNQYFISTHSAHLMNTPGAHVFHVRYDNGCTKVEPAYTATDKSFICADLGYRPSDLFQANCVIWVEGPSDRIYLNHWIQQVDSELLEGIHYSIMFYGGNLLSHLTAQDPEVEEFISLRRLNRHITIVMDSDRSSSHGHLNSTKKRIKKEFNRGPGFAWVTKGREIENYVDPDTLEQAVKQVHRGVVRLDSTDPYDHSFHFWNAKGELKTEVEKVKIARAVVGLSPTLDVLDLRKMINRTVRFIREANSLE